MAGSSMTFSYDEIGRVRKVLVDWTSDDTTGAVSGTTKKITGFLIKGITDPGTPAPSASYDIAITDEESLDVLAASKNNLQNRSDTTTEQTYLYLTDGGGTPLGIAAFPAVADKLTVAITNAGNSKQGQLILYYEHRP